MSRDHGGSPPQLGLTRRWGFLLSSQPSMQGAAACALSADGTTAAGDGLCTRIHPQLTSFVSLSSLHFLSFPGGGLTFLAGHLLCRDCFDRVLLWLGSLGCSGDAPARGAAGSLIFGRESWCFGLPDGVGRPPAPVAPILMGSVLRCDKRHPVQRRGLLAGCHHRVGWW